MRNSIDQADEQTHGANKSTLLSGDRAVVAPEPGSNEPAKPARAASPRAYKRIVPRAPVRDPNTTAKVTKEPAPPRPSIEVIEGAKKKTVDFP